MREKRFFLFIISIQINQELVEPFNIITLKTSQFLFILYIDHDRPLNINSTGGNKKLTT